MQNRTDAKGKPTWSIGGRATVVEIGEEQWSWLGDARRAAAMGCPRGEIHMGDVLVAKQSILIGGDKPVRKVMMRMQTLYFEYSKTCDHFCDIKRSEVGVVTLSRLIPSPLHACSCTP